MFIKYGIYKLNIKCVKRCDVTANIHSSYGFSAYKSQLQYTDVYLKQKCNTDQDGIFY